MGWEGWQRSASRCQSLPSLYDPSVSVCQSVLKYFSEATCCPFISSLLIPPTPLFFFFKNSWEATNNSNRAGFLPVTVDYLAIGGSAGNSLRPLA